MMIEIKNQYKIVEDSWCGYEVQIKRWWFPFWCELGARGRGSNTSSSTEQAQEIITNHKSKVVIY